MIMIPQPSSSPTIRTKSIGRKTPSSRRRKQKSARPFMNMASKPQEPPQQQQQHEEENDLTQFRTVIRSLLGHKEDCSSNSCATTSMPPRNEEPLPTPPQDDDDVNDMCHLLAQERASQRESMLAYLHSMQEFLQEETDPELRAECIREVFAEIRQHSSSSQASSSASCQFAHNKYASDLESLLSC